MSLILPEGLPFELGGHEWKLVWTLAVVERVQDHFDESIGEVILRLTDERRLPSTVAYLLSELINDDIDRRSLPSPKMTEETVKWLVDVRTLGAATAALLKSYGIDMPDDEDDPKNASRSLSP